VTLEVAAAQRRYAMPLLLLLLLLLPLLLLITPPCRRLTAALDAEDAAAAGQARAAMRKSFERAVRGCSLAADEASKAALIESVRLCWAQCEGEDRASVTATCLPHFLPLPSYGPLTAQCEGATAEHGAALVQVRIYIYMRIPAVISLSHLCS